MNAERSTGPRSGEGKRRSAHNALRHGLTVPLLCSAWGEYLPRLEALLRTEGFPERRAGSMAVALLNYERALSHQRDQFPLEPGGGDECALRQLDRHLRRAANQLFQQCRESAREGRGGLWEDIRILQNEPIAR
ncbi:hypothetical protein [Chlorobium sp. N1]|uniref:hypothetical protein n=1 Tax=Chlorobium sp. N1 TaxID=2491138 RepID=UPI00103E2B9A|nr:hypothetical protein [Chlorobium sp. N1]TCD47544.1 hypothetical protein E0L29_06725 [Chlorobium sp. N1]